MPDSYNCFIVSGAKQSLSHLIYEKMTDNGDGTYSYSYSVNFDGAITIIIKLVTSNGVLGVWYGNAGWSGSPVMALNYPVLYINRDSNINWTPIPGGSDYKTALFYTVLKTPALETCTFTVYEDNGATIYIDGVLLSNNHASSSFGNVYFNADLSKSTYHTLYFDFYNDYGNVILEFYLNCPSIGNQLIPQSSYSIISLVASSPIQITVSCPTGYTSSDPTSPTACKEVCGDGIKVGTETCDDGNTNDGDGCQGNCGLVATGYVCSGGTITIKDVCILCTAGFYPNTLKTECVTHCGDGLKAGSEKCDDGNITSGDGCSSSCTVEDGYKCWGGSTMSSDTCVKCDKGFYTNYNDTTQCITKCGDGMRKGSEACDDGNIVGNDGCAFDCMSVDDGYVCVGAEYNLTDVCFQCDMGYDPNPNYSQCVGAEVPVTAKSLAVASVFAAMAGLATNVVVSMFSSSSSSGSSSSFGMINQLQLVILLPLIQTYLPDKIYNYLKSMNSSLFNADFIPTSNSGYFTYFKNLFDFNQIHTYLKLLGLTSGSAFVNILNLTVVVLTVIILHIFLLIIYSILFKLNILVKIQKLLVSILESLTFGFYIGVYLETYILFLLVTFSEIYFEKAIGSKNSKSTIASYVIVSLMGLFILLTLWQWCKSRKQETFERQKYFKKLLEGMRPSWICRSYYLVFLIRRSLFGTIMFFCLQLSMMTRVVMFTSVQFFQMMFVIVLRPQESVKERIIDIINEVFYFYYAAFLLYYNVENRWNNTITDVYFWILISNNFILIFIMIVSMIIMLMIMIKNKCCMKKVIPKENIEGKPIENNGTARNMMSLNYLARKRQQTLTNEQQATKNLSKIEESKDQNLFTENKTQFAKTNKTNTKIINNNNQSRRLVGAISASASTISGTGIASSILAKTAYTITVTAKDSAGNNLGYGGNIFLIRITNKCTFSNEFVCTVNSGARNTVSSPIYQKMTDNGDGTYSYSYTLTNDGAITVIVKLSTGNGLFTEWFPNTSWTYPTIKTNISSNVYYDMDGGLNWVSLPSVGNNYFSAYLYGTIIPPTTQTYTFNCCVDDGPAYILLNSETSYYIDYCTQFSLSLTAGKPYDMRFQWLNTIGNLVLKLYWSTSTIGYQYVPSSYYYVMRKVGSSPIQITVSCPNGYSSSQSSYPNQCHEICGDGIKIGNEMCDDGNTISNDGCQSDCTLITSGYACTGGGSSSKDICSQCLTGYIPNSDKSDCVPKCGDGLHMPTESCDDGNTSSGDGCSNVCEIESGYSCTGGSTTTKDTCVSCSSGLYQNPSNLSTCIPHCGDGKRAGSEICDDANTSSGDGCSSDCSLIESGYSCSGGTTLSQDTCTLCTSGLYPNGAKSQCIPTCGDGLKAGSEKCDDGNLVNNDGCKSDCSSVESGYVCSGGSPTAKDTCTFCTTGLYQNDATIPSICIPHCGDSIKASSEQCDDGNNLDNDGCQADCTLITPGYVCSGGSLTEKDTCIKCSTGYAQNSSKNSCIPNCGDGLRYGSEKCDDGNTSNEDGCKSDCSSVESGWVCSGGSTTSKDICTKCDKWYYQNDPSNPTSCIPKCGDGMRVSYEHCDDGNTISGDGCSSDCMKIEDGWACFGGYFGVTDICVQCDLGYDPNPDYSTCIGAEVSRDVKAMSAAAQIGAYMGVASNLVLTIFSSSSSSSSNSFGMINQIQLVIIFPLIGPYIPEKIYDYLKSMSTSLFNLNFLPTSNTESTISFKDLFDFKQQNSYLYLLELKSGSAFVNILDLTTTVGFVICIHIILLIIFAVLHKLGRFSVVKKVILKILEMLTFGFYIGVCLETYLLFLLVEFSEIHYQNKSGVKNLKSTVMSYVILFFMLLFISLAFWQWLKSRTTENLERLKYFKLLVEDMKPKWICRAYWLLFLLRRTVFLAIIFFMGELEMIVKVILFVIIQIFYLGYIAILRPQGAFKENLIDFINEVFYFYFVGFMLYYNSEERWSDTVTDVYFWIMMSNNFILMFVIFMFLVKSIVKIVRDLCRKFKVKPKERLETTVQDYNRTSRDIANLNQDEITNEREENKASNSKSILIFDKQNDSQAPKMTKNNFAITQRIDSKVCANDMIVEEINE